MARTPKKTSTAKKPARKKGGSTDPGRPSTYTQELADEIIERLANGETLNAICRSKHMPHARSVRRWALDNVEGFAPRYAQAREIGYHYMADEVFDFADRKNNDRGAVARDRLRVDTRKWLLAKVLPKMYGDRVIHSGDEENPVEINSREPDTRKLAQSIMGVLQSATIEHKNPEEE